MEDAAIALDEMTVEIADHERSHRGDGTDRTISRRHMKLVAVILAMVALTPRHRRFHLLQTSGRRRETAEPSQSHRPRAKARGEVPIATRAVWAMGVTRRLARTLQLDQWSRTMAAGTDTRTRTTVASIPFRPWWMPPRGLLWVPGVVVAVQAE